ncbi:MAG: hypothetical protein LBJ47_00650 [Tannerella sp.]|jgi:hypothetical protein|nr:hypothetical protein [Tannerella sp.]
MKKRVGIQQQHVIRFRRWSRKGYAAFCSIGRCVLIGRLGKTVVEASLRKQNPALAAGLRRPAGGEDIDPEDEAEPDLPDIFTQVLSMLTHPQTEVCGGDGFVWSESENGIAGWVQQCVPDRLFVLCH